MRRCVFLAVLLSLVLNLSKGESDTTNATTPAPTTATSTEETGKTNAATAETTAPAPSATTTPTPTGETDTTNATTPAPTTATSTVKDSTETPTPSETTTPTPTGETDTTNATTPTPTTATSTVKDSTETPALSETTTPTPTGETDTTNATTPTPTTATSTVNDSTETPTPSETTTPTPTGETDTTNATTPAPTTATSTVKDSTETPTPSETTAPTPTGETDTTNATTPSTTTPTTIGMNTTSSSATTPPGNLCNPNPCGTNLAECIALYSISICQCRYGYYYSNKDCHRGKIYPGVITLKDSYSDSVQTVNSVQYQEVFQNVTAFFKNAFQNLSGYAQTVIVEILPLKEGRDSLPRSVVVINLFMENSTVNNVTVTSAIENATTNLSYVSQYRDTTHCAVFNCDPETTECIEDMFPTCTCQSGFSKTEWDERSCSDCSNCSGEENKYCAKENGVPTCKCMSNFEMKNGKCVFCPVGYSGDNCSNNRELILIIVGTVFGAIILILAIAIFIISIRAKHKKDPERKSLIKSGYSNPNAFDDRETTIFPRVQTTSGHANPGYQPNNHYEMRSTTRDGLPERDYDDLYDISREPEGFRTRNRY